MASIAIATMLALAGCAGPQVTSPVGEWIATDDDHGTLTIHPDGTFAMTDASYNPLEDREADNDFNATGTWRMFPDDPDLSLDFVDAAQGDWDVNPGGFDVGFRSGTIRFEDVEGFFDIEFRLVTDAE